jgi:hypothetical protein
MDHPVVPLPVRVVILKPGRFPKVVLLYFRVEKVSGNMYNIHMKRTNLVLDEHILDHAKAVSGSRTYSETVQKALLEYLRRHTFNQIDQFASSGIWEGDLAEMRQNYDVPG